MYREVDVLFLTIALDNGEWSASYPGHFTSWNRAVATDWLGDRVSPRAGFSS